jgi:hypothetical protein
MVLEVMGLKIFIKKYLVPFQDHLSNEGFMKNKYKTLKLVLLVVIIILCVVLVIAPLGVGMIYGIVTGLSERSEVLNWKNHTKPIDSAIAVDLCVKFNISSEESICKQGAIVYGPEFYPFIIKSFCPEKDKCVSITEVNEKIGEYKYSEDAQDSLMPDESNRYWYDFQSDHMYPLIITYYKNGTIEQIQYDFGN